MCEDCKRIAQYRKEQAESKRRKQTEARLAAFERDRLPLSDKARELLDWAANQEKSATYEETKRYFEQDGKTEDR